MYCSQSGFKWRQIAPNRKLCIARRKLYENNRLYAKSRRTYEVLSGAYCGDGALARTFPVFRRSIQRKWLRWPSAHWCDQRAECCRRWLPCRREWPGKRAWSRVQFFGNMHARDGNLDRKRAEANRRASRTRTCQVPCPSWTIAPARLATADRLNSRGGVCPTLPANVQIRPREYKVHAGCFGGPAEL